MKQLAATALRDCLCQDWDSARQRLREMSQDELGELQRACMALQNLAGARHYAVAQWEAASAAPTARAAKG